MEQNTSPNTRMSGVKHAVSAQTYFKEIDLFFVVIYQQNCHESMDN